MKGKKLKKNKKIKQAPALYACHLWATATPISPTDLRRLYSNKIEKKNWLEYMVGEGARHRLMRTTVRKIRYSLESITRLLIVQAQAFT